MTYPVDIVYVIPRPEIGGAERQLLLLIQGLDTGRFRPHVICLDGEGSLLRSYAAAAESLHVVGRRHTFDPAALARLVRIIRGINPAVAHTWLHIANVYGGWAAKLAGVPHVLASHRGLAKDPQHGLGTEIQKRALNLFVAQFAERLIANAGAVARRMWAQGFDPFRTHVVHNGLIDTTPTSAATRKRLAAELGLADDDVLIGAIARLDPKKDLATMLRAIARVAEACSNVRLLIVGGGYDTYREELEALAERLGIRSRVVFLGFRNDAQAVLSLCDISVLSSVTEGLPNAVLESMMLGKPVVSTRVGGVPELISDGVEGFLVAPRDPEQFADRILRLVGNPQLAEAMGRAGRARALRDFTVEAMVRSTQRIYDGLLEGLLPEPSGQQMTESGPCEQISVTAQGTPTCSSFEGRTDAHARLLRVHAV